MSQTQSDTFKLSYPFTTAAGTSVEQVELKRLTVKDLKQVRKISKDPADWDEPLIARSTGILPKTSIIWILPTTWSCRNDFSKSLGWARATKTLMQAQGLLARWFRFQPGRLMPSILTIWRCGWSRLKSKSEASSAIISNSSSLNSRYSRLFCMALRHFPSVFPLSEDNHRGQ